MASSMLSSLTPVRLQVRAAIAAAEAKGYTRSDRGRELSSAPVPGVLMLNVQPDFRQSFGCKLNYQDFKCSRLSDLLDRECSDFLQPANRAAPQFRAEVLPLNALVRGYHILTTTGFDHHKQYRLHRNLLSRATLSLPSCPPQCCGGCAACFWLHATPRPHRQGQVQEAPQESKPSAAEYRAARNHVLQKEVAQYGMLHVTKVLEALGYSKVEMEAIVSASPQKRASAHVPASSPAATVVSVPATEADIKKIKPKTQPETSRRVGQGVASATPSSTAMIASSIMAAADREDSVAKQTAAQTQTAAQAQPESACCAGTVAGKGQRAKIVWEPSATSPSAPVLPRRPKPTNSSPSSAGTALWHRPTNRATTHSNAGTQDDGSTRTGREAQVAARAGAPT